MKANSKHYALLIMGLLTLVISSTGYWYVYKTTIKQAQKHSFLVREIENNEANNREEVKLLELSSSTMEKRAMLSSYFISDDKILDFIKSMENVEKGSSAEVTLSGIDAGESQTDGEKVTGHVKVRALIKGDWVSVNKAVSLIENLPYSINVSSVTLRSLAVDVVTTDKKSTTVTKKNIWEMSLEVNALTMK
jgi:hypothetical protein